MDRWLYVKNSPVYTGLLIHKDEKNHRLGWRKLTLCFYIVLLHHCSQLMIGDA